jgi:hypothetical protein
MDETADLGTAQLRVARPSDDLNAVVRFYRDGLGFEVLYEFRDHDGFDGVMLGRRGTAYHLEFTQRAGHRAGRRRRRTICSSSTYPASRSGRPPSRG